MKDLLIGPYTNIASSGFLTKKEVHDFLFNFDWDKPWIRDYLSNQLNRYTITLDYLSNLPKESKILEIGAIPFGLTLLLRHFLFKNVTGSILYDTRQSVYSENRSFYKKFISRDRKVSYEVGVSSFNIEKDIWPYNDESFDLIVCAEVIEHLALDPMHVISEANRVLRGGGKLFISTPNLISLWKLHRMFDGLQPIVDPFYRLDSVYSRHNRELTPNEIKVLYESGGFEIDYIHTLNVKKKNIIKPLRFFLIRLLAGSISDRKDIIFAMGTKKEAVRERYPAAFQLYKKSF